MFQNNRINNLKYLEPNRKALRNNPTESEKLLWLYLRNGKILGRRFRRQFSILNYILDFYCFDEKLAIELDGKQHYTKEGVMIDTERDAFLTAQGITVLRFENGRVFGDLVGVLKEIRDWLEKKACN
jgi:very-short-patch-repair endonuclease